MNIRYEVELEYLAHEGDKAEKEVEKIEGKGFKLKRKVYHPYNGDYIVTTTFEKFNQK